MSYEIAIKVENLSKCYQIYSQPRDRLKQFLLPRLMSFAGVPPKQYFREFWALKNVSFEIRKGQTVGIIGRNGSGKSTLLQIICGTLSPSNGAIETRGRLAALLELGSGFNPEFTGRENVYLNGAVLGLSTAEIDSRFSSILEFSEIGDFIDQPVKTYSSGMMIRLAFSVSINVDPDILIVDEALSVGDELFQRKCFSRIESMKRNGTTVLFVSHSGATIIELCDQAILLDSGELLESGIPNSTIGNYQKLLYAPHGKREKIREAIRESYKSNEIKKNNSGSEVELCSNAQVRGVSEKYFSETYDPSLIPTSTIYYESRGASIQQAQILNASGARVNILTRGQVYIYRYRVVCDQVLINVRFGMLIKSVSGLQLGGGISAATQSEGVQSITKGRSVVVEFSFICHLNPGVYFMNAGVLGEINGSETYLHRVLDVVSFRVKEEKDNTATGFVDFSCSNTIRFE